MATLSTLNPTMLDVIKAQDPDGSIAVVAEILNETHEILDDVVMIEGNLPTGHRTTQRSGLPEATFRRMYGFVNPDKSTRVQVTDSCGMLEAYAEIDKALADLNGNTAEYRMSEDRAFIEGMGQTMATTMFEGNTALNPERFDGFNVRFNDTGAENADNLIDAGGTGSDNASIWLVGWGANSVHGIYPKGSKVGLQMEDKGQVTIQEPGGTGRMEAYRSHYRWDLGLTVRDWRYVVRIHSIDRSALTTDASSGANLPALMFEAESIVPNSGEGVRWAYYMDRDIRTKVMQQSAALTSQSTLQWQDVGGRKTLMSPTGVPMRRVDALNVDEAAL